MPASASAYVVVLSLTGAVALPEFQSPMLSPTASSDWDTQLDIAKQSFAEALAAVKEAHRLMPIAIEHSVIYEETKDKRNTVAACEQDLARAKDASGEARRAFNSARGLASTTFLRVKRAVEELRRLDPDPADARVFAAVPFASDVQRISKCLSALESKLYDRVNSALTRQKRCYLWRDTKEYVSDLPDSWDRPTASALVPESVLIPCTGQSIPLHVEPEDGSKR